MVGVNEIPLFLFSILVFPGLIFVSVLTMLSEWWLRKITARAQKRMGPSYVGPFGILQPFADFIKLITVKEEIRQKYSTLKLAKVFAFLGIGAVIAVLLLLPLSPLRLVLSYDIIAISYFCCVWVPLATIVMALSLPNPFTAGGVSRLLSIYAICEPAYFISILVPIALVNGVIGSEVPYSVFETSQKVWMLWSNPVTAIILFLSLVAVTVVTQSKAMLAPFNIPEAEQELIAGPMTEFSGPLLALSNLLHESDLAVTLLITTYLFLGGPYPFPHLSILGVLVFIAKYIVLLTVVAIIRSVFGRFRIEQAISTLVRYSLIPSVIALVAAMTISAFSF